MLKPPTCLRTAVSQQKNERTMYLGGESNPYLKIRNFPFYPLNYQGILFNGVQSYSYFPICAIGWLYKIHDGHNKSLFSYKNCNAYRKTNLIKILCYDHVLLTKTVIGFQEFYVMINARNRKYLKKSGNRHHYIPYGKNRFESFCLAYFEQCETDYGNYGQCEH